MKRVHPVSPTIGVGVVRGVLFFSHLSEMKMHNRDMASETLENIIILELKTISLFTLLMIATAHTNAGRLIK